MRRAVVAVLGGASLVLAGCTGIPSASDPQVITSLGGAAPSPSLLITPEPGADPRTIVSDFLIASATDDLHHAAARGFLTPDAQHRWSDTTVTVVDTTQVSNFSPGSASVVVTGRRMGSLDADGIYVPVLQGDGGGGVRVPFTFGMKKVTGQWRIDNLQNGIIIGYADFQRVYQQRQLYFFDLAEKHLVADLRYTTLTDNALLANWLISQMASGPRPELQSAVRSELPGQTDPTTVKAVLGTPTQVQVPGAAQLDPATRNRLAAQIAFTLSPVATELSIVDSGRPVNIQQVGSTTFTSSNFAATINPPHQSPTVYYLNGGRILDGDGDQMTGRANGQYELTSVAISSSGTQDLRIAGTAGFGANARLYVGTQQNGLGPTPVHGVLSRPSWAPNLDEVWVGDGPNVYRVGLNRTATQVLFSGSGGAPVGRVRALRFSPEGTRIAMVLTATDGTSQVWIGSVVRSADNRDVTVDSLEPISPQGIEISDVSWNGQLKLFAIGREISTGESSVYETQVDGSLWTPRGIGSLPSAPESITIAENEVAWVSTGQTVWAQGSAGSWVSPKPGTTTGTNPVYLE